MTKDLTALSAEVRSSAGRGAQLIERVVTRICDQALHPHDITSNQFILLAEISFNDGIAAVELVSTMDIEKSTLSRNLKKLIDQQLIYVGEQRGRTGRPLHLTKSGQDILTKAYPKWQMAQAEVNGLLGASSLGNLRLIAQKLTNAIG